MMQRIEALARQVPKLAALAAMMAACKPADDGPVRAPVGTKPPMPTSSEAAPTRSKGDEVTLEAKRAYAAQACAALCEEAPGACKCETILERGDWLFLRMSRAEQAKLSWSWFVMAMVRPGYRLLAERDRDPSRARGRIAELYSLCRETTDTDDPPTGAGLMNVEVFELFSDEEMIDENSESDGHHFIIRFDCKQNISTRRDHFAYECDTHDCDRIFADAPGLRALSREQAALRQILHTTTPRGSSSQKSEPADPDEDVDKWRWMSSEDDEDSDVRQDGQTPNGEDALDGDDGFDEEGLGKEEDDDQP